MSQFNESDTTDFRIVSGANGYRCSTYWPYPAHVDMAPESCGVYILFDGLKNIQYIGKAGGGRLKNEIKAKAGTKDFGTLYFRWFLTASDISARSLESDWGLEFSRDDVLGCE